MGTSVRVWILRNAGIAGGYFILGKLALALALPPGFVSAIWPAAGLAFAVTALWGGRYCVVGLLLGSAVLNASVGGSFHLNGLAVEIATGSCIQAIVGGAWLNRRLPDLQLDGTHRIITFTLVGVGSSLIAAAVGNLALYLHGFIAPAQIPQSFVTWWLGDAFGVQIFTPLSLLVLAPNLSWRRRRLSVGPPLFLAFLLFTLAYYFVRDAEEHQLVRSFNAIIDPIEIEAVSLNQIQIGAIAQLATSYSVRNELPGAEFLRLATQLQSTLPAIRDIRWTPVRRSTDAAASAAPKQAPVRAQVNAQANTPGANALAEPAQAQLEQDALKAHTVRASLLAAAANPAAPGPGPILVVAPIETRAGAGLIHADLQLNQLSQGLSHFPGVAWEIRERSAAGETSLWHSSETPLARFDTPSYIDRQGVYTQKRIRLADRDWNFVFFMPHRDMVGENGDSALLVLILALLASSILSSFLLVASSQQERVEHEVQSKTAELSAEIEVRRRQELALEQAKSLAENATLAKSQFLAVMSHEIRTPMNAILGMHTLLLRSQLTTQQQDYAKKSESAARSLLVLLDDILDFSKIEAGKMTLDSGPVQLDQLLGELSSILGALATGKDLELVFDLAPDTPNTIRVDSVRLKQVLVNLGGNAIKFTNSGTVTLSVRPVRVQDALVRLAFSVQDTGIGIAPENQQRIFDGFAQAEVSTSRRFGGTGLGLAISTRIVELMGGKLRLQSEVGKGSTFDFEIDCPILPAMEPAPSPLANGPGATCHVLVIDDNKLARELLRSVCKKLAWTAELAASGAEALRAYQASLAPSALRIEHVIVDWEMPEMNGWQTAAQLRALAQAANAPLKILMVSANSPEMLSQRSPQERALIDGFLVKPVTAAMVVDAFQRPVESSDFARASAHSGSRSLRLNGMRLLVVEDNVINQQIAQELLCEEGAHVTLAENGQIALDTLRDARQAFTAVLMDVQMPVMDGYSATRAIRSELGMDALPVIAMTANAMQADIEASIAAGMNRHVSKPFELTQLVNILLEVTRFEVQPVTVEPALAAERLGAHAFRHEYLDVQSALGRFGNNLAVYTRALRNFGQQVQENPPNLRAMLAQGQITDALHLCHGLKGLTATLGAQKLSGVARDLEFQLKSNAIPTEATHTAFDDALRQTLDQLHRFLTMADAELRNAEHAESSHPPTPPSQPDVNAELLRLQGLLLASDMQALEVFEALLKDYPAQAGDRLAALKAAMAALDFSNAALACQELLQA